ncbi:hypothetical protein BKA80DRAFT_91832 [Phyllosticta citrichinensis]
MERDEGEVSNGSFLDFFLAPALRNGPQKANSWETSTGVRARQRKEKGRRKEIQTKSCNKPISQPRTKVPPSTQVPYLVPSLLPCLVSRGTLSCPSVTRVRRALPCVLPTCLAHPIPSDHLATTPRRHLTQP